ncbi:hypothetical protein [Curtobacterium sp. MCBD17_021]|uniref:hypothetical protein n=1 Tax=Curtobacterium sp. MCBD17_021 TaxID=2175665 RepID=UPI000DAA2305|nr:hypothetical protein [Curtobacterium sp. MCBD17_021]PZE65121.1 hypothetical protein DEI83_10700 [Curtobacterium sp. MCBD17_021]
MSSAGSTGLRLALRFPTTFVVTAPYVLLFLPLAVWNANPQTDFILQTWGAAVAGTLAVEGSVALVASAEHRAGRSAGSPPPGTTARCWHAGRVAAIARGVSVVAITATSASVLLGAGTLRSQVDSQLPSGAAAVLTPFVSWTSVALALLIAAYHLGGLSRAVTLSWIGALLVTQIGAAYVSTITVRAAAFVVLLLILAFLTDLVPRSWIAAAIAVLAVVWPTVYAIRNQLRVASGIDVSENVSASDRLRFDEQIARAAQYGPGHDLGQAGLGEVLRYGLVPRFLDPGRDGLSSGNVINEFLGGVSFSSYTFLPVATAWFFWGTLAVVLLYGGYATVVMSLRPWRAIAERPYALIVLTLVLSGPLSWFGTPPDTSINLLQTLVSTLPVFFLLRLWARRAPIIPGHRPDPARVPGAVSASRS